MIKLAGIVSEELFDKCELMNPDDMNSMEEERDVQESEEYSFLKETVKKPPVDIQKILIKLTALSGAAILFGVIAALVFYAVLSWRNSVSPNPVTIPADEQPVSGLVANSTVGNDTTGNGKDGTGKSEDLKNAGGGNNAGENNGNAVSSDESGENEGGQDA